MDTFKKMMEAVKINKKVTDEILNDIHSYTIKYGNPVFIEELLSISSISSIESANYLIYETNPSVSIGMGELFLKELRGGEVSTARAVLTSMYDYRYFRVDCMSPAIMRLADGDSALRVLSARYLLECAKAIPSETSRWLETYLSASEEKKLLFDRFRRKMYKEKLPITINEFKKSSFINQIVILMFGQTIINNLSICEAGRLKLMYFVFWRRIRFRRYPA